MGRYGRAGDYATRKASASTEAPGPLPHHGTGDARRSQLDQLTVAAGPGTGPGTPLDELAEVYLADLEARASERHVSQVRSQLGKVLGSIRATTVEELRPMDVIAFRNKLRAAGKSNRCCNVYLQAVKGMLSWALQVAEIASNPLAGVRPLPTGERHATQHRRALSEDEIERLLAAVEEEDRDLARHFGYRIPQAPFFRAFLETGARYGELIALVWADLDRDAGTLTLRAKNTKAGRKRTIPITARLARDLAELPAYHALVAGTEPAPSSPIFRSPTGCPWPRFSNNIRRIFDRLMIAAGIPQTNDRGEKVDIHALRHTAITRYARAGVPLAQTQAIAGHSDPKLTARIYTHLELDDLRSAVDRLGSVEEKREPARLRPVDDLERDAG